MTKAAARNPETAIAVLLAAGLAGWYCHRRGWITGDRLRAAGHRAASAARPLAQRIAAAGACRNEVLAALTVVETLGPPSLEERCARHLARLRTAASPGEVAAMLSLTGRAVTGEEVDAAMAAHPAFTHGGEDGYVLDRPAKVSAITGGIRPADLEPSAPPRPAEPVGIGQFAQATAP